MNKIIVILAAVLIVVSAVSAQADTSSTGIAARLVQCKVHQAKQYLHSSVDFIIASHERLGLSINFKYSVSDANVPVLSLEIVSKTMSSTKTLEFNDVKVDGVVDTAFLTHRDLHYHYYRRPELFDLDIAQQLYREELIYIDSRAWFQKCR
jgi:hypothetical protein